jgi:hypothetical protein
VSDPEVPVARQGAEFTAEPTVPNNLNNSHQDQNWRKVQVEASRQTAGRNGDPVTMTKDEGGLYFPPKEGLPMDAS